MNQTLNIYFDKLIKNHKVIVFMKGEQEMPMCGFSNTVIQILNKFNINYHTINVLENNRIRQEIKTYSQWPTIPQVYINGDFIGGADIILQLYEENKLHEIIEKAINE